MVGKNNQYVKKIKQGTKVETYSIKKFKVGIASVAIGCSVFFGAGAVAMAGEQTGAPVLTGESNTTVVPKGEERAITGNQSATGAQSNSTPAKEGKIEPEKPKATVNKAKLETLIKEVEGLNLEKYTEESVKVLKTELAKAKEVFETAQNKEEVEAAWRTLFTYKNSKLVVKKTPKLSQDNTPKPDTTNGKETVGINAENTEPNGTNIAGHNHSLNGTTRSEGSGFRNVSTELTDIEWGIKSGFGDSYRTNDRRVFVVRNDDSTFKVPIKIVSGSNNITELTATSASGAALTLTPKNLGSKNAVLTVSGRFSDSKKGSDVINVTVKTGSGQKTFQVGVYHPFQKPTIEVPSNVPQGTTINDYLKDKAGKKPTINVTLPVAPKIPTGAEMKVYLIGSYDSTDYTQDDQNQNPHDYDILATKTVTEGNTTVTIEESDYKKNLPAREIRALTVIELSTELSGKSPDTNPGIRGSYYSDPATVGNPTPAVDKSGAINAITTEEEKQNSLIDSKQNVFTSTEVSAFKKMVTDAANEAKNNINKTDTDTDTEVNTERDKGILALDKIGAIVEIDAAQKAKEKAIEDNADIAQADKQAAKAPIGTAADAAKGQINAANAAADVTTAKDAGLLAINKAEAIAEIDAVAEVKKREISRRYDLVNKIKDLEDLTKITTDAIENVKNSNTSDEVERAKDSGIKSIRDFKPHVLLYIPSQAEQSQPSTPTQPDQGSAEIPTIPSKPSPQPSQPARSGSAPSLVPTQDSRVVASPSAASTSTQALASAQEQVDKSELRALSYELDERLKALTKVSDAKIDAAKTVLLDAKKAISDSDLTEQGLRDAVEAVKKALASLKDVKVNDVDSKTAQDKSDVKKVAEDSKDSDKMSETNSVPVGVFVSGLLALLGVIIFWLIGRKKESELKQLSIELTKVLEQQDVAKADKKVLAKAQKLLQETLDFVKEESGSAETEAKLVEQLKAIITKLQSEQKE